jgi:hypothetical protein
MRNILHKMDIRDISFKYCKITEDHKVIYFKITEEELYYFNGGVVVEYRGETVKNLDDECYIFDMNDRIRLCNHDNVEEITEAEFNKNKAWIIKLLQKDNAE